MMQAGLKRYIQPFICYIKVDWWTPEVFTRCHLLHLPPCLFTSITAISERGGEGSCRGYSAVYSATLGK